jgi:hypothetical protein
LGPIPNPQSPIPNDCQKLYKITYTFNITIILLYIKFINIA